MANIAEGYERRGAGEYLYFLGVAKSSSAEVSSHLYVAFDVGYLAEGDFESLMRDAKRSDAFSRACARHYSAPPRLLVPQL